MITTPEEYFKYLWGIETQRPLLGSEVSANMDPTILEYLHMLGVDVQAPLTNGEGQVLNPATGEVVMISANPLNNKPVLSIILPSDERTFDVDLSKREISVPTFLSVQKDHKAETIYFLVDRYYEQRDLSEMCCMIEFINAAEEGGFYPVPFYDISTYRVEDKMLIPWNIEGIVTRVAGPVQFALRFYKLNETGQSFIYNIRTKVAQAEVLNGLDESVIHAAGMDEDQAVSFEYNINQKIENICNTVYWTDLPKY